MPQRRLYIQAPNLFYAHSAWTKEQTYWRQEIQVVLFIVGNHSTFFQDLIRSSIKTEYIFFIHSLRIFPCTGTKINIVILGLFIITIIFLFLVE
jgi:hypothetical protein